MDGGKERRHETPAGEDADLQRRRERQRLLRRQEAKQRSKAPGGTPEKSREDDSFSDDIPRDPNADVRRAEEEQRRARHLEASLRWRAVPAEVSEGRDLRRGADQGPEP